MYTHLRIKDIKALKKCDLTNLGRINIVCGRNNSGKSTLLEGINSAKNRFVGKVIIEEDIEALYSYYMNHRQGGQDYHQVGNAIRQTFSTSEVWYSDERERFLELFRQKSRGYGYNEVPLDNGYNELFLGPPITVLLPPKRRLELSVKIDGSQSISPAGLGILNHLFFAKNQSTLSEKRKFYDSVFEAFGKITSGFRFQIIMRDNNELELQFASTDGEWIKAQDCGLGLQDTLVIVFFSLDPQYNMILIEEPESHLHPEMQRKLLYFLREDTEKQYLITTHSNVFLDSTLIDKVFFTTCDPHVEINDATSRAFILADLGYSVADNLVSDLVILTEGPTDIPFIEEFLMKFNLIQDYNIKVWPLGGNIMDQLDLSVFSQNYSIIALIDKDPESAENRKRFIKSCEEQKIPWHQLQKYALENYYPPWVLREVYGKKVPEDFKKIEPKKKLKEQIGFNVKKKTRKLARKMTIEDIKSTDLYEFFQKVIEMCEANNKNSQKVPDKPI